MCTGKDGTRNVPVCVCVCVCVCVWCERETGHNCSVSDALVYVHVCM